METEFAHFRRARSWTAMCLLVALSGCALTGSRNVWQSPPILAPSDVDPSIANSLAATPLAVAELHYAAGLEAEKSGNPACLDFYFAAATESWPAHVATAATANDRGTQLYRASVTQLVSSACKFGKLDPKRGISLPSGQLLPMAYYGFTWQPEDFHSFLPVGTYRSQRLDNRFASAGVGIPYVVLSGEARRPFTKSAQPFAATGVLQPNRALPGNYVLAFYCPMQAGMTDTGLPLARDITAPIAYAASQENDDWITSFIRPDRDEASDGLRMREPFQPKKIPVVLVHGLLSDPLTWCQLENDLRAQPEIESRYQIWTFRYDTSDPFLTSARTLRRQLAEIRQAYDPSRTNPNMSRMVIIGHSLGGLLTKLQVTYSGNELWDAAANQPLSSICTDEATRADLAGAFYFQPSPDVSQVIFIATPHRGSMYAQLCIGRLSSALVQPPAIWQARHEQLIRDNPDAFRSELDRRVPTSIDFLEPDSEILQATMCLPYRPGVALHSIIGDDRWTCGQGRSDGVVSVESARLEGVQSEIFVDAEHTQVQRRPETSREVTRILLQNAATASQATQPPLATFPACMQ